MWINFLISELKSEILTDLENKPEGKCKHKDPIMVGNDGIRCVECRKLVEFDLL